MKAKSSWSHNGVELFSITREGKRYRVSVRPPHVAQPWHTPQPMNGDQLCRTLMSLRVHGRDAMDLIAEVDAKFGEYPPYPPEDP